MFESPELTLCNKTERVTIFQMPPISTTKGYYLDDWQKMIWEGGVKVTEKDKILTVSFVGKDAKVFAETKISSNPSEVIKKTVDSSRGYAVRLKRPNGGYAWIGVAFRDRNDAFDFGVVFQDFQARCKLDSNPNALNDEFNTKMDFSLKKGEKVKISVNSKKQDKNQDFFGNFANDEAKKNKNQDFFGDFGVDKGEGKKKQKKEPSKHDFNLLDL